jgi:protoporphyrinogen oxidase
MRVAVIGAGPAGITAAYQLAKAGCQVEVFEAEDAVGGMARSMELWGQRVDLGPHRFFSSDPRVNGLWHEVVGDDYRMVDRLTRISYNRRLFHYPLRPVNALWNMGLFEACRCVGSYLAQKRRPESTDGDSFESWVVQRFGRRLFEMFFKSYTEKLWGIPCSDLDADFAAQRIKKFSLGEAIKSVFGLGRTQHKTLVDQFAYPLRGAGMVYEMMAQRVRELGGHVYLNTPVARVEHSQRRAHGVTLENRQLVSCDYVISTMPLTLMVGQLDTLPPDVQEAVDNLTYRNTILVYLEIDSENLFPDQWLYIHSPELRTGRISNFRNWIPEIYGQAKTTILALEYWCYDQDATWRLPDDELIALASREIRSTGLLGRASVLRGHVHRIHRCYPVYGRGYKQHLDKVVAYLRGYERLMPIGRYGAFKYNNQDHSILMGMMAAENVLHGQRYDLWSINTDYEYQEAASADTMKRAS